MEELNMSEDDFLAYSYEEYTNRGINFQIMQVYETKSHFQVNRIIWNDGYESISISGNS